MGSLGNMNRKSVPPISHRADAYRAMEVDSMKHMVMAMVAVALVFASVIGALVLSDVLHVLSRTLCASLDLPELVRLA